MLTDGGEQLPT